MIKEIVYVTSNPGKIHSLQTVLDTVGISVIPHTLENLEEIQANTAQEVAGHKARTAYAIVRKPLVVQDSAFIIPSRNGFPGPYTKYILETVGVEGLLRLIGEEETPCAFEESLVYKDAFSLESFTTLVEGTLITQKRGLEKSHATSPLWQVFIPKGQEKTLAEMSEEELISWRNARETQHYGLKLISWLKEQKVVT